jgi:hypothetical protein
LSTKWSWQWPTQFSTSQALNRNDSCLQPTCNCPSFPSQRLLPDLAEEKTLSLTAWLVENWISQHDCHAADVCQNLLTARNICRQDKIADKLNCWQNSLWEIKSASLAKNCWIAERDCFHKCCRTICLWLAKDKFAELPTQFAYAQFTFDTQICWQNVKIFWDHKLIYRICW